jgi:hypothetical protein
MRILRRTAPIPASSLLPPPSIPAPPSDALSSAAEGVALLLAMTYRSAQLRAQLERRARFAGAAAATHAPAAGAPKLLAAAVAFARDALTRC